MGHVVVFRVSLTLLMALLASQLVAPVLAYEPTRTLMDVKGYSNETIRHAEVQRDRQQWIAPNPDPLTPTQRLWRNFYYGDWTATVDDFGREKLREYPWWDEDKKAY
ncbi:MAG: hypothetical protein VKK59_01465 [Vampirovibrionales bacterium]|nr:hypothetical protein [Vampirovibrionales bacterium]